MPATVSWAPGTGSPRGPAHHRHRPTRLCEDAAHLRQPPPANDSQSLYNLPVIEADPPQPADAQAAPPAGAALDSAVLLAGRSEVQIVHGGEVYRLRCTRAGKLILTK